MSSRTENQPYWHCALWLIACCAALLPATRLTAQQQPAATTSPVVWYEVDPNWPQRPAGVDWGAVSGVAVDREDRVWVFTRAEPPIQVYDGVGKFLRGFGQDVIAKSHHIKIGPAGGVWVTDIENHTVVRFSPTGEVLMELGTRGEAGDDEKHFNMPTDVAIAPDGDIFVSDGYGNHRIVQFDRHGKYVKSWGSAGRGPGQFDTPHAIAIDSAGRIYVADRSNARVQVFNTDGKHLDTWANAIVPWGFAVTDADELWVCGSSAMALRQGDEMLGVPPKDQLFAKFNSHGRLLQLWTLPKGEDGREQPGELNWVHAIALDSAGNIYAGDITGQRAQKFLRRP